MTKQQALALKTLLDAAVYLRERRFEQYSTFSSDVEFGSLYDAEQLLRSLYLSIAKEVE